MAIPKKRISHAALLRRISARNDALIAGLGQLSASDKAAIVQGFQAPHCELCTTLCRGCKARKDTHFGPCPTPHSCGLASEELQNVQCCLLAHARRPCKLFSGQKRRLE